MVEAEKLIKRDILILRKNKNKLDTCNNGGPAKASPALKSLYIYLFYSVFGCLLSPFSGKGGILG